MRNTIVGLCSIVMLVAPVYGQTALDGGATVSQGAVKGVVELVPSFNEVLWYDVFGAEYIEKNTAIFVKQKNNVDCDLFPFRVVVGDMQLLPKGTCEILYEDGVPGIDLFQGGVVDHADRMNNIGRRYRARLSSCDDAYDWCVEHGDWPTWGDSLLFRPQP